MANLLKTFLMPELIQGLSVTARTFFLAEYANMILVAALASLMFLGGWLSPFPESWGVLGTPSFIWFAAKMCFFLYLYLWFRATFPRYRYDQIMRLGWKVFIPVTLAWIFAVALMVHFGVFEAGA